MDALKRADWTPLMLACTKSGPAACRCINALLTANANAHLRNKDGWTPLLIACRTGDDNAVNLLLKHLPQSINDRSNNGRSALHIAGNYVICSSLSYFTKQIRIVHEKKKYFNTWNNLF